MASIIVVDDDDSIRGLFARILERAGHQVRTSASVADFLHLMESMPVEIVLLDIHLPDGRGEDVIPRLLERDPFLYVIAISGDASVETAVSATKKGAYDYLTKPFTADTLLHVVAQAVESRRLSVSRAATRRNPLHAIRSQRRLVGSSAAICAANLLIDRWAKDPFQPVLLFGEKGTGKELAAQSIHQLSARREGPLIRINCGAISRPLALAELFGNEEPRIGSSSEPRKGLLELADGGMVFLEEISELEPEVQERLRVALRDKQITRVGGTTPRGLDIRLIAATTRHPEVLVANDMLDRELYESLRRARIDLPPLRNRVEDIEKLAHLFLQECSLEHGRNLAGFEQDILDFFGVYDWPGNVRELRNVVERLVLLSDPDTHVVDERALRRYCFQPDGADDTARGGNDTPTLACVEKRAIQQALETTRFERREAARLLGVSPAVLQRKIATHRLAEWIAERTGAL